MLANSQKTIKQITLVEKLRSKLRLAKGARFLCFIAYVSKDGIQIYLPAAYIQNFLNVVGLNSGASWFLVCLLCYFRVSLPPL